MTDRLSFSNGIYRGVQLVISPKIFSYPFFLPAWTRIFFKHSLSSTHLCANGETYPTLQPQILSQYGGLSPLPWTASGMWWNSNKVKKFFSLKGYGSWQEIAYFLPLYTAITMFIPSTMKMKITCWRWSKENTEKKHGILVTLLSHWIHSGLAEC